MDYLIIQRFQGKIEDDWEQFYNKELEKSKEELFRYSYNNAIACEWYSYFYILFENGMLEACTERIEKAVIAFLDLPNIFETFLNEALPKDELEFSFGAFDSIVEQYIDYELKIE